MPQSAVISRVGIATKPVEEMSCDEIRDELDQLGGDMTLEAQIRRRELEDEKAEKCG